MAKMWFRKISCNIIFNLFFILIKDILCLKDVKLTLEPSVVKLKGTSTLRCTYDLEGDKLYSVKWYRGSHEFYRYDVTAESPSRYFEMAGTKPDLTSSNSTQVVLTDIDFNLAGNFTCEVTTDEPNIHTRMDWKIMFVVQPPSHPPVISVGREPLDYGDILRANCSSYQSRPPASLKFILNNNTVNQTEPAALRPNVYKWSDLQLELKLSDIHFNQGRLILKCVAQIPPIYLETAELELESRHPVPARVSAPSNASTKTPSERIVTSSFFVFLVVLMQTC